MEGSSAVVRVRLLSGEARDFTGARTVNELRLLVAEAFRVDEEQVVLTDGLSVLRTDVPLRQIGPCAELTAAIRQPIAPLPFELRQLLCPDRTGRRAIKIQRVRDAVRLPDGADRRQWLCARLLASYRDVADTAAALEQCCTRTSCPCMRAGKHFSYRWAEPGDRAPPRELPAPDYCAALLRQAHRTLGGAGFAPEEVGLPIDRDWLDSVRMLLRRFFRIYAHAYLRHLRELTEAGHDKEMNFGFQHFLFFVREFDLVGSSDMAPLKPIIEYFEGLAPERQPYHF